MSQSPRHIAALKYAAAGIPVLPCRVGDKPPACAHGVKDATCEATQIDRWWNEADYNIGLALEGGSLCAVDLDGPEGEAAWFDLQLQHGFVPDTYEVKTPRGLHLYFRGSLPPTASRLGAHIDTRGRASFVLAPPSIVGGKTYEVTNSAEPVDLPAWIDTALLKPARNEFEPAAMAGKPFSPAQLVRMLAHLDPDCPRDEWRDIAAALHAAPCSDPNFDKRELFISWSRGEVRK